MSIATRIINSFKPRRGDTSPSHAAPNGAGAASDCRTINRTPPTGLEVAVAVWLFTTTLTSAASVHVNPDASASIRSSAEELALWLQKASGEESTITTNAFDGTGVYLAIALQDTSKEAPAKLAGLGPEGIYIKATTNSLVIIGNSELAVQEGVYIYLEKIGFRWFFPHEVWHIVPTLKKPFVPCEILTRPDYENRRIWSGYGTRSTKGDADQKNWDRYNRMGGAFRAGTGHAFPGIINRNKAEFEKHPEYFAILADGQRDTTRGYPARKFCVSNEGLVQLCIADAFRQFEASKDTQMVSLDPSDGPGSCECDECKKIGTVSDRVFHLANRVAKAVGEKYPGKWVGLYAYSDHQMPTSIQLAPNVYVQMATAFNTTPYTIDQLVELWGKRVTKLGIREYYGVMAWDMDMPGIPRGARIGYVRKSIPHFHSLGANAINAESGIGWISRGLGQYVAAKLMWDTRADVDALVNDFYDKSFGKARAPMEDLYTRWQRNMNAFPTSHELAQWLKLTDSAMQLAGDDATRGRIEQVQYYLHYVALYYDARTATGEKEELKTFDELMRYAWRVKDLGVCASYPLARRLASGRAPTPDRKWNAPDCVWKSEKPVSREELAKLISADRDKYKEVEGIREIAFPTAFQSLETKAGPVCEGNVFRGGHEFIVQITKDSKMQLAFGFVYDRKFTLTAKFYALAQDMDEETPPALEHKSPSDLQFREVDLHSLAPGFYRMMVDDRRTGFQIKTDDGLRMVVRASPENKVWTTGRSDFYFHIPKGTTKLAFVAEGPLTLQKPGGEKVSLSAKEPMREIAVKEGEEGIWKILQQTGRFYLLGIPPMVSLAPQQLLVPGSDDVPTR